MYLVDYIHVLMKYHIGPISHTIGLHIYCAVMYVQVNGLYIHLCVGYFAFMANTETDKRDNQFNV